MTTPAIRSQSAPAPSDGDNRYKAVQHKLNTFAGAMDAATSELEQLYREMRTNGDRANASAGHIANAGVDPKFVEMTTLVSQALSGAVIEVGRLNETAHEVAGAAHEAQTTHSKLYGALDEIRSSRPEKSPRPGFLTR